MIITFHNFKGGTGNTTLVAHLLYFAAKELHLRVAGAAVGDPSELLAWLTPHQIPVIDLDPTHEEPDLDLIVLDLRSTRDAPMRPDVTVIPISDRGAYDGALALTDQTRGPVIWLPNKGYKVREIPTYLEDQIEITTMIPYSRAIERTAPPTQAVLWADPELAYTPGSRDLRIALRDLLERAVALSDNPLTLPPRHRRPSASSSPAAAAN
jgi:hypothetical protein